MQKWMHTYSSEQNRKYYDLSYSGAKKKRLTHRMVPQGRFVIRRRFREIAFCSKDVFKVDGIHNGEAAYPEGGIFMPRRAVMERTISIRRAVFGRMVLIQRAVVERTVQKVVS